MADQSISFSPDDVQGPMVDYFYLSRRVARILALPVDPADWTEEQTAEVNDLIHEGLRMFYTPPIADHGGEHVWTFMNPTTYLTIEANKRWYDLPYDFDHMDPDGTFTYAEDDKAYPPIPLTSESRLRKLDFQSDYTAYPRFAALRVAGTTGEVPEHWEVGFFPTPDKEYLLQYTYHAVPHPISRVRPYPVGAASHGQLILLAVEAAAEMYEQDGPGHRHQRFMQQLASEIAKDRRRGARILGYNGDGGRWRWPGRRSEICYQDYVTYKGQQYLG